MPEKPLYIDGVERIEFVSGTVRIGLFYNSPTEYDEKNHENAANLVMTLDGFISIAESVQKTLDMLVEKGILTKKGEQE